MAYSNEEFGHRLKVARVDARMNQADLAEASGVNANSIARYELGEITPGFDKVCALASALGITVNDLCPVKTAKAG